MHFYGKHKKWTCLVFPESHRYSLQRSKISNSNVKFRSNTRIDFIRSVASSNPFSTAPGPTRGNPQSKYSARASTYMLLQTAQVSRDVERVIKREKKDPLQKRVNRFSKGYVRCVGNGLSFFKPFAWVYCKITIPCHYEF